MAHNSPLDPSQDGSILERFQWIEDVPLVVRAELDRRTISFEDLIKLDVGSLLPLSRPTGENIDLYAGEVYLGSGEILVVDSIMAVRIADLRDRTPASAAGGQSMETRPERLEMIEGGANGIPN